jgi:hypothetical protein
MTRRRGTRGVQVNEVQQRAEARRRQRVLRKDPIGKDAAAAQLRSAKVVQMLAAHREVVRVHEHHQGGQRQEHHVVGHAEVDGGIPDRFEAPSPVNAAQAASVDEAQHQQEDKQQPTENPEVDDDQAARSDLHRCPSQFQMRNLMPQLCGERFGVLRLALALAQPHDHG